LNDIEHEIIRTFSSAVRQTNLQGLQAMQDAKRLLIASGMSPIRASTLLATTLRALGEEAKSETLS
jgi:conjugal transfer/entry exclusion protein